MGYDMYTVQAEDAAETAAKDQAHQAFGDACNNRSKYERGTTEYEAAQLVVDEAFDALRNARKSYFALNISGMGYCMDLMQQFGMMHRARHEGEWPAYPELPENATAEQEEAAERVYDEACAPFLAQHPGGEPGIPSFKFSSNDGWLVTEDECRQAVEAWKATGSPTPTYEGEPVIWWGRWIEFLEHSATRGGFKVH